MTQPTSIELAEALRTCLARSWRYHESNDLQAILDAFDPEQARLEAMVVKAALVWPSSLTELWMAVKSLETHIAVKEAKP
jgi:hypothetical protein